MANKSAYFQLENREDGIYLLLFPGVEENHLDFREIDGYLNKRRIEYDKMALMQAVSVFQDSVASVKLCGKPGLEQNEALRVIVDEERRIAIGRFYPPSEKGQKLTKKDIASEMVRAGVKYGANRKSIEGFLRERQYCRDYTLANATPPVDGVNASITYHFNTDLSRKPKLNADGSVDFHQLDIISHVTAGQCLATLKPAVQGTPGTDVTGRTIAPLKVKPKSLRPGKNSRLSEDGLQLISLVDGYASLVDGDVFVSDVYEVPADVGVATGDVTFNGNVLVRGNVLTGFSVRAEGDIIVEGVVEGAELVAGGQIILKRGIQGMNRGRLMAKGNIVTKFIQSAEVSAGGYVSTEAILHSNVVAGGEVVVSGKKGFVNGGEIHSGEGITVKTAGSAMGAATLLEVGNDPERMAKFNRMGGELPHLEAEIEELGKTINLLTKRMAEGETLSNEKLMMLQEAKAAYAKLETQIFSTLDRMDELKTQPEGESNGSICVSGTMYAGCRVILYNTEYYVRDDLKRCKLIKERAEVKVTAL